MITQKHNTFSRILGSPLFFLFSLELFITCTHFQEKMKGQRLESNIENSLTFTLEKN